MPQNARRPPATSASAHGGIASGPLGPERADACLPTSLASSNALGRSGAALALAGARGGSVTGGDCGAGSGVAAAPPERVDDWMPPWAVPSGGAARGAGKTAGGGAIAVGPGGGDADDVAASLPPGGPPTACLSSRRRARVTGSARPVGGKPSVRWKRKRAWSDWRPHRPSMTPGSKPSARRSACTARAGATAPPCCADACDGMEPLPAAAAIPHRSSQRGAVRIALATSVAPPLAAVRSSVLRPSPNCILSCWAKPRPHLQPVGRATSSPRTDAKGPLRGGASGRRSVDAPDPSGRIDLPFCQPTA